MKKILKIILIGAIIGGGIFFFRAPLINLLTLLENKYFPCSRPIQYSIGSFDKRFGISKDEFESAIREAEAIWEKPIDKELFAYAPGGDLKINLIYDTRQEATFKLQKLGIVVNDDRASYDALKSKYEALKKSYTGDKAALESRVALFKNRQKEYETEVEYWNKRDGAPEADYDRLNSEKESLDAELLEIKKLENNLNAKIEELNSLAIVLNRLAGELNIQVAKFNEIGGDRGEEFEEGNYQSGPEGREIYIYQFDDRGKLVRVLAHEMGHALGLDHLEDPKAIMYRLNNGVNAKLTGDDLEALKKHCRLEKAK